MERINTYENIRADVDRLRQQRDAELQGIREHIGALGESLKPGNLIQRAGEELYHSSAVRKGLFTAVIGLSATWLIRRFFQSNKSKRKERSSLQNGQSSGEPSRLAGIVKETGFSVMQSLMRQGLMALGTYLLTEIINKVKSSFSESVDLENSDDAADLKDHTSNVRSA